MDLCFSYRPPRSRAAAVGGGGANEMTFVLGSRSEAGRQFTNEVGQVRRRRSAGSAVSLACGLKLRRTPASKVGRERGRGWRARSARVRGCCRKVQQQFAGRLRGLHHRGVSHTRQQLDAGAGHRRDEAAADEERHRCWSSAPKTTSTGRPSGVSRSGRLPLPEVVQGARLAPAKARYVIPAADPG